MRKFLNWPTLTAGYQPFPELKYWIRDATLRMIKKSFAESTERHPLNQTFVSPDAAHTSK